MLYKHSGYNKNTDHQTYRITKYKYSILDFARLFTGQFVKFFWFNDEGINKRKII